MKRRFSNLMAGLAAATSLVSMPLSAAGPTSAEIQNDAATPGDVLSYGMGPWQQRFSTLDKLNSQNVAKLVPAFASSLGGEKQREAGSQPIVYDGTIYVTVRIPACSHLMHEPVRRNGNTTRLPDGIMPCCVL